MDDFAIFKLLDACYTLRDCIDGVRLCQRHIELALSMLDKGLGDEAGLRRAQTKLRRCESIAHIEEPRLGHKRRKASEYSGSKLPPPKAPNPASKVPLMVLQWLKLVFPRRPRPYRQQQQHWQRRLPGVKLMELGFPKALLAEWHQACSIAKSLREKIDMILDFDAVGWEATSRPAPARRRLGLSSQQLANNGYGSSLRELFGSLQLCSQGLNSSLSTLASHVERIIHDLIADRMVLLELQSRYVPISSNPLLLPHHIL